MPDLVVVAKEGHVATVTLARPTMPPAFFTECERAFRSLAEDSSVRAVVVRSESKAFSYGLDLPAAFQELGPHLAGSATAAPRHELLAIIRRLQGAFTAIAEMPVPVVCAVHGACIGGGLDLATACDVRLASADAFFSLRETKIAIVADLGSLQRLPAIVGKGVTRELAFTGKDVDARRALAVGLVNDVFADRAALDEAALAMARAIAENPPLTVRGVKDVLDYGEGKTVEAGLAYVAAWNAAFLASEDLGEALAAFLQKRAPAFQGR
jgi:enoyl-CoA hydratase